MHVTTAEAALAGVLITAVAGWIGGFNVQRSSKARDHYARLWDRQVETYESALTESHKAGSARRKYIKQMRDGVTEVKPAWPGSPLEPGEREKLLVRMLLYGSHEVATAFLKYMNADNAWVEAWNAMRDTRQSGGHNPEEVVNSRKLVKERDEEATKRSVEVTRLIQQEIQAIPKGVRWPRR